MPRINELLILHHTHTDIGYTHPQPILWELQRRFIDRALDFADATATWDEPSRFKWTCETTAPVEYWLQRASAAQIARFRAAVGRGQIGCAAAWVHQAPLVNATQIIRDLQGVGRLREALGLPLKAFIGHDINGMPWPIVSLLKDAGVELFIMGINIVFGGFPFGKRPAAFRWAGPDGRSILAFSGEHYAAFEREMHVWADSTAKMAEGVETYLARRLPADYPLDFAYLTTTHPFFVDNNGPCLTTADLVRRWNAEGRTPHIRFILPEELHTRLAAAADKLPLHAGDWTDYWNFGAASSANETRINRNTRARLTTAEALLAAQGPARDDSPARLRDAAFHCDMYEEHTWGASASCAIPDRDGVREQWNHKAHYAYHARSLTSLLLRDQLEALAGNPAEGVATTGIVAVNAAPVARKEYLRIPKKWAAGNTPIAEAEKSVEGRAQGSLRQVWQHMASTAYQVDFAQETLDDASAQIVGPIELPPLSARFLTLDDLRPAAAPHGCSISGTAIESPFFRVNFDPATGRITSVLDKSANRELVNAESPWGFFAYVHERPEQIDENAKYHGREALMEFDWSILHANIPGWKTGWKPVRTTTGRPIGGKAAMRPDGPELTLTFDAPGLNGLTQTIKLLAARPAIVCDATLQMRDTITPEAMYFAFPLKLAANWKAHFDTADIPVEFDKEQLPGVARDYVTVNTYAAMHDDAGAVVMACPDAPLVQIGDFHFGRYLHSVPRPANPLLLGFVANNYWMTNFKASQPGPLHVRYELSTLERFDPAAAAARGSLAIHPVESHPLVTGSTATPGATLRLLEVQGDHVAVLSLSATEDGLIANLVNSGGTKTTATLTLPAGYTQAARVDTLGQTLEPLAAKGSTVQVPLPTRGIIRVKLAH